jgi:hypothetical protein
MNAAIRYSRADIYCIQWSICTQADHGHASLANFSASILA